MVVVEALELGEAVLQDLEGLQARLQIDAPFLHLGGLGQILRHVVEQAAVVEVRPAPAGQRQPEHGQRGQHGALAQQGLVAGAVLAHQVAVGEDDLREQLAQEVAVVARRRRRRGRIDEPEAAHDVLVGDRLEISPLERRAEVETAEHRLELEGVVLEEGRDEGPQRRPDRRELGREGEQPRLGALALEARQLGHADRPQALVELVEMAVEDGQQVVARRRSAGQRGAPHPVALGRVEILEEGVEAGDQVGLGEQHIHRRKDFQPLGELLHPLAQALGELDGRARVAAHQLADADGDDDAVDRRPRAVLLEQVEEAQPLGAVFLVDGVAAGGIEQDALGGEEPVAVAGAADALDHRVAAVLEGKGQAAVDDGAALAGGGVADGDVPGQLVERLDPRVLAEAGRFNGLDRLLHALAQGLDFGRCCGARGGAGLALAFEKGADRLAGLPRPAPAQQPDGPPGEGDQPAGGEGPDHRQLQRPRAQQHDGTQGRDADGGEHPGVGQKTVESGHRGRSRGQVRGGWPGGGTARGRTSRAARGESS